MPIRSKEVFDRVCDHNSGRGARETLHIFRLQQLRAGWGRYDRTRARAARKLDMPLMPPSQALTWAIRCTQYPVRSLAYPCQTIETLRLCIFAAAVPSGRARGGRGCAGQRPHVSCAPRASRRGSDRPTRALRAICWWRVWHIGSLHDIKRCISCTQRGPAPGAGRLIVHRGDCVAYAHSTTSRIFFTGSYTSLDKPKHAGKTPAWYRDVEVKVWGCLAPQTAARASQRSDGRKPPPTQPHAPPPPSGPAAAFGRR